MTYNRLTVRLANQAEMNSRP